jgi:sugar-phosphatase
MTPGAILSDLDGVLVDSEASCLRVWDRWAQGNGLDPEAVRAVLHGRPSRDVVAQFLPDADLDAEARRLDAEQAADVDGVVALPGARELLLAPPAPLAVVTSCTAPLAAARLETIGLPAPRVLVTSDQLARGKPDPEGYLRAAALLGVAPADCVVLEDAPAGVAAGLAAGCRVVAVRTTHGDADLEGAHAVVDTLADLSQALAALQR